MPGLPPALAAAPLPAKPFPSPLPPLSIPTHPPAPALPQAEPEKVQAKLEAFLKGRGIPFSYSKSTKFANWIHKTLV